jgi:oligosaccharide repeat unit polymerase
LKEIIGVNKCLIIIISLFCLLLMTNIANQNIEYSNRVFLTSIIIQFFSIVNIFSCENEPYSLNKIFYLFALFFFGISPLLQFYNNTQIWYSRPLTEAEYFYTNILIIFILLFFRFFYDVFRKVKISSTIDKRIQNYKEYCLNQNCLNQKGEILIILISLISFLIVFQSNHYNIIPMLIRGGDYVTAITENFQIEESPTKWLIVTNFIRPMPMICFLYYLMTNKKKIGVSVLLFIIALISSSPTGLARYNAAAMYIPVVLLLFPFVRKRNVFSMLLIVGFLFVFPFLNIFRNFSEESKLKFSLDLQMFTTGDFDSYQNFALIVSKNIITYGKQLLGVLFFWIPRSLWPGKPIGSGAFIAEKLNFIFSNVSANYFAEGFINFGFFGIFLFLILMAYVTARFDKIYWTKVETMNNNFLTIIYMICLGMLFFILRGDLLSSFAYTVGFILSGIFIYKIFNTKKLNI